MQPLTIHLLLFTIVAAAHGETETMPLNSQTSSLDYVYPNYALQYLGLGDSAQQQSSASSTNNPIIHTPPDQQGYVKYITYTSDGKNVYQMTVRVKPGTYPVIWSTPVQSQPSAADVKSNSDLDADNNADSQPSLSNHDGHLSKDVLPMTLPSQPGGHELPEATTCHYENQNVETPEQPVVVDAQDGREKVDGAGQPDNKDASNNIIPGGNENYVSASTGARILPQYFPGLYGGMSFYPVAYNPFTGQRKYIARPVANAKLTSMSPTAVTSTTRPSSIPVNIPTSGAPMHVQPVSYVYPYMTYHAKHSGVIYQVPAQQINAGPQQVIRWVQTQPTRYQPTYPQGYMSYQPAVLTMRNPLPLNQNAQPKLSAVPTMHSIEPVGQQ